MLCLGTTTLSNSDSSLATGAGGIQGALQEAGPEVDEPLPSADPVEKQTGEATDDIAVEVAEQDGSQKIGPLQGAVSNYRIVITSVVYCVLSSCYGLVLGLKSDPSWKGLTIGMLLLVVPITAIPVS